MAIYRAPRPDTQFTQVRNDVARDDRLSYRARGILVAILSNADDWSTTSEALARRGTEGRDAIQTAMRELEACGYLVRVRRQDERGRWTNQAVVYDTPQTPQPRTVQGNLFDPDSPEPDFQASVQPGPGKPAPVSQALIEEHQEHSGPTDQPPAAKQPADLVATAAYEAMDKMGNYMALRQVAAKALKAGHAEELVTAAFLSAIADGRPCTGQVIHQRLTSPQGGTVRNTNHDHWTTGGGFTAQEGPTP